MPNFETVGSIKLQGGDELAWEFYFPPANSSTEKGAIPYNTSIIGVDVVAYNSNDEDVTNELISNSPFLVDNVVSLILKYPATSGDGRYKLTFFCTLNTGQKRQFDFHRVICKNK
jgi:hypothetical protein